jgi:hypothetical protein
MRPPKPKKEQSLSERLIRAHGFKTAMDVLTFIAAWCIVCESLGRPPETIDEYSDWWRQSRSTGFREQKVFRECMPGYDTPTSLWEDARSTYAAMFKRGKVTKVATTLGFVL